MRFIIVPILFLYSSIPLIAHSQTSNSFRKDDYDITKFKVKKIGIAPSQDQIQLKNIGGIRVIDARADTTAVGFMQKNTRKPVFLLLDNGLQNGSEQFINSYCRKESQDSSLAVFMVIKKLWLTDGLDSKNQEYENNKIKVSGDYRFRDDANEDTTSGLVLKIEFYAKVKLSYYALYRYDSSISGTHSVAYFGPEYIRLGLTESLSKLANMDRSIYTIIGNRKAFNFEDLKQHNDKSFDLPVLKDSVLKSGAYLSFEEFKTNRPSQTSFQVKKEKLTDIVYIKEADGKEYARRDIWGYCDGKNAYIKSSENFFLLQRKENAFYVYGSKKFAVDRSHGYIPNSTPGFIGTSGVIVPSVQTGEQNIKLELKPFQLDWDTGKLY